MQNSTSVSSGSFPIFGSTITFGIPRWNQLIKNLEDTLDLLQSPRLATSEQIFGTPWYDGLFIDQVSKSKIRSRWKRANSANSFSSPESYDEQKERRDEKGGVGFFYQQLLKGKEVFYPQTLCLDSPG